MNRRLLGIAAVVGAAIFGAVYFLRSRAAIPTGIPQYGTLAPASLEGVSTLQKQVGYQNQHSPAVATLIGTHAVQKQAQAIAPTISEAERAENARRFALGAAFGSVKSYTQELSTRFA